MNFHTSNRERMKAVDFFCGAGGMSYGLSQAGIEVLGGIDNAGDCRETYLANIPGAAFIERDVLQLDPRELGSLLGITYRDPRMLFFAGSPCQFWTSVRTDKRKSERTAFLLDRFRTFVDHFEPGYICIENVPGFRREGAPLEDFVRFVGELGYEVAEGVVNAHHYNVPQNRLRYLMIASRVAHVPSLPPVADGPGPTVRDVLGVANGYNSIPAGHRDESDFLHSAAALTPINIARLKATPVDGGTRLAWADDPALQLDAYRNRGRGFSDVYGRMRWDAPSPTITTKFISLSNGRFGHPDELRAISLREGATLQSFPSTYQFLSTTQQGLARQIGNAVPPELARHVGRFILSLAAVRPSQDQSTLGTVQYRTNGSEFQMSQEVATLDLVRKVFLELRGEGESQRIPSINEVLAITGGSKSTVSKRMEIVLRELTGEFAGPGEPEIGRLHTAADPFLRTIWSSAKAEAEAAFNARLKVVLDVQQQLYKEIDQLNSELAQLSEAKSLSSPSVETDNATTLEHLLELVKGLHGQKAGSNESGPSSLTDQQMSSMMKLLTILSESKGPMTKEEVDQRLHDVGVDTAGAQKARYHAFTSAYAGIVLTKEGRAKVKAHSVRTAA
nr:DNA cytosine methyltransferase [uncultured Devosia sp.]